MIGILGGTFDPVHVGHLGAAEQVQVGADLDEVWLMPNFRPPHKAEPPHADARDRLAMVELAVKGKRSLRASDLEVARGVVSYTLDTLEELGRLYPRQAFAWLLGYDAALRIREWHRPEAVLKLARFIVFDRPSTDLTAPELYALGFTPERTRIVHTRTLPVSAHDIRERLKTGRSIEGLVPPPVAAYIHEHELYGSRRRVR